MQRADNRKNDGRKKGTRTEGRNDGRQGGACLVARDGSIVMVSILLGIPAANQAHIIFGFKGAGGLPAGHTSR
jgi:hypothetical protein